MSDQERDQAAECLREHMAAGRLDANEFDERLGIALSARYRSDLEPLFLDLPLPHPTVVEPVQPRIPEFMSEPDLVAGQAGGCSPMARRQSAGWNALVVMAWTAGVVTCVAMGWNLWWLLFIPFVMGMGGHRQRSRITLERHQQIQMQHAHQHLHQRRF